MYLLAEPDARIVALALKILGRVLVLNGNHYVKKFSDPNKGNGFFVLKMRLRRWYHVPAIWVICYAIFFGIDVAVIDLHKSYTAQSLLDAFGSRKLSVVYPEAFTIIAAMLNAGLKSTVKDDDHNSKLKPTEIKTSLEEEPTIPMGTYFNDGNHKHAKVINV